MGAKSLREKVALGNFYFLILTFSDFAEDSSLSARTQEHSICLGQTWGFSGKKRQVLAVKSQECGPVYLQVDCFRKFCFSNRCEVAAERRRRFWLPFARQ